MSTSKTIARDAINALSTRQEVESVAAGRWIGDVPAGTTVADLVEAAKEILAEDAA